MGTAQIPDPTESVRHQLRPLFDQIVIKELDQDRVRRSGLVVPPGTHEPPPEQGIVLAVGPGLDWWAQAGVEMPVAARRPRRLPGRRRRLGRDRRGAAAGLPGRPSCSACSSRRRSSARRGASGTAEGELLAPSRLSSQHALVGDVHQGLEVLAVVGEDRPADRGARGRARRIRLAQRRPRCGSLRPSAARPRRGRRGRSRRTRRRRSGPGCRSSAGSRGRGRPPRRARRRRPGGRAGR